MVYIYITVVYLLEHRVYSIYIYYCIYLLEHRVCVRQLLLLESYCRGRRRASPQGHAAPREQLPSNSESDCGEVVQER